MEQIANQVIFGLLALVIVVCSILTVTTRRILRAATYLLFVLFATAGIYFQLDYTFLGAVQLAVYAGGIVVLFVFSILLTSHPGDKSELLTPKTCSRSYCFDIRCNRVRIYIIYLSVFHETAYQRNYRRGRYERNRACSYGYGQVSVSVAFRSCQCVVIGLYHRWHYDCP